MVSHWEEGEGRGEKGGGRARPSNGNLTGAVTGKEKNWRPPMSGKKRGAVGPSALGYWARRGGRGREQPHFSTRVRSHESEYGKGGGAPVSYFLSSGRGGGILLGVVREGKGCSPNP